MAKGIKRIDKNPDRDPMLVRIGEKVKALREAKEWTQKEFASQAGVSAAYIYLVESGQQNMTLLVFRQMADALGISMESLLSVGKGEISASEQSRVDLIRNVDTTAAKIGTRIEQMCVMLPELRDLSGELQILLEAVVKAGSKKKSS
jgi:transcriptional regulator with XRE-family HTH domain